MKWKEQVNKRNISVFFCHFLQCDVNEWSHVTFWKRLGLEGPPYLEHLRHTLAVWSPLQINRIDMTVAHSRTWTRTLSQTLWTLLNRCKTPGQIRTGSGPCRCLTYLSPPPPGTWTSELSRLPHQDLYRLSVTDPDRFWGAIAADRLRWVEPFHLVRDCEMSSGKISWFLGGKLNVSGENRPKEQSVKCSIINNDKFYLRRRTILSEARHDVI